MHDGQWLWMSGVLVGATTLRFYSATGPPQSVMGLELAVNRFTKRRGGKTLPFERQLVLLAMNQELLVPRDRQADLEAATEVPAAEGLVVRPPQGLMPLQYSNRVVVHGWTRQRWVLPRPYGRTERHVTRLLGRQRQAAAVAIAFWVQEHRRKGRAWQTVARQVTSWQRAYAAGRLSLAGFGQRGRGLIAAQLPEAVSEFERLLTKLTGIAPEDEPQALGLLGPIMTVSAYKTVGATRNYGEPAMPQADYEPQQAALPAYQQAMFAAFGQSQLFRQAQGLPLNFGAQGYFPPQNRWTEAEVDAWRKHYDA